MPRFPTRAERLAAERAKKRASQITDPPRLNPPFPYRVIGFEPGVFAARRALVARED